MSTQPENAIKLAQRLSTDGSGARMRSLESPAVPELLGARLAGMLAARQPTTIVVWDNTDSAVLGHVVARELSAELVHAFADEGILGLTTEIEPGTAAAIVSYDWAEYPGLEAMVNFLRSRGIKVVGVGSVVTTAPQHQVDGIEIIAIASANDATDPDREPQ